MQSGAWVGDDGQSFTLPTPTPPRRYTLSDEMQIRDFSDKSARNLGSRLFDIPALGSLPAISGDYGPMPSKDVRRKVTTISGAQDRIAPPPYAGAGNNPNVAGVAYNKYTGHTHRAGELGLNQQDSASTKRLLTDGGKLDTNAGGNGLSGWYFFQEPVAQSRSTSKISINTFQRMK